MRGTDPSLLARVLGRVDAAIDGKAAPDTVATGFASIDRLLGGGMRRGDLVVLGGDVASGKSVLALAIGLRAAGAGSRAALFTAEFSPERVMERALCIEGRARVDDLRVGALDDASRAAVGGAALRLRELPLTVHDLRAEGAAGVAAALPRVPAPALVVVDSLPAAAPGTGALDESLALTARELKALARERDAALLLVTPLPRLDPARANPRPRLGDLGALGAPAQHADVVLALFREEMYGAAPGTEGATELLVLKNRNGPTGYVDLYFDAPHLRFEDMLDPEG